MHIDNPLITVIIPSFNRVELIGDTLDSVLLQTYLNWECIVIDDCSTDGTQNAIAEYAKKDHRFRFIERNREPKGAPVCRNIGIENAIGEYIVFLDSDDILTDYCLENRMRTVDEFPDNDFWVFGTAQFKKLPGDSPTIWNVLNKEIDDLQRLILQDIPWHTMGPLWSKRVLLSVVGFDENAICWQDWELHIRILLKNYKYWKSNNNYIDSYYRNDKDNKRNSISKNQNDLSHLLFRVKLFSNIFNLVTSSDGRQEIRVAFSVLFFNLFLALYKHHDVVQLKKLSALLKEKHLYTCFELFLINLVTIHFKDKRINLIKFRFILKLLIKTDKYKFNNRIKSTFQS